MKNELVRIRTEVVERLRSEQCLTRSEFGLRVGCTPKTVAKILAGEPVQPRTARQVADAFGLSVPDVAELAAKVA